MIIKNCTKHSIERWVERVVGIKTNVERDHYISENRDKIKEDMNTTFMFSDFIYKGQIGDNITRNYYIKNDIVFCLNTTDDAFVTVFKVDFGFTSEINLQVSKGLISEIYKLVAEKENIDEEFMSEMEELKHESYLLQEQEDLLKEQIKVIQEKRKSLDSIIKTADSKSKLIELDIKKYTNHLVNSKDYRNDLKTM